jgi:hypothetical protein
MKWLFANFDYIVAMTSIIETILGLPTLLVALMLRRTIKSDVAASNASKDTLARVSNVVAVVSIEQICSRSRDLLH